MAESCVLTEDQNLTNFPALMQPRWWGVHCILQLRGLFHGKGTFVPMPLGSILAAPVLESWIELGPENGRQLAMRMGVKSY